MKMFRLFTGVAFLLAATGCSSPPRANVAKVDLAAEEAAIRRTDADWLAGAAAHDLDRTVPFWSDDATILAPGMPPVVGKEAIRKYVAGAFATPGFSITWKTERVDVARSGDMAYSSGSDRMSFNGPDGKPVIEESHSVAVWKKQPDGAWKCVMDVMSPSPPPAEK